MSAERSALVACIVAAVAGIALTHAHDLRRGRIIRIALSLPVVWFAVLAFSEGLTLQSGFSVLGALLVLTLIWFELFAHLGANGVVSMLFGNQNLRTGVRADFSIPRAFEKRGEYDEALQHALYELEKEPMHYEGLMLLSALQEKVEDLPRAIEPLELLLSEGALSEEQRYIVARRRDRLAERVLVDQLNAR